MADWADDWADDWGGALGSVALDAVVVIARGVGDDAHRRRLAQPL
eukprot:COSAG03_NODE_8667_length_781_cov_134.375367_2_plen_44_part_01